MKKLTVLLLTIALLLSLLPTGITKVRAAGTTVSYAVEGGNIYFDTSTGAITDCDYGVTVANIPNHIEGVPVTAIGDNAFYGCSMLTTITIPDSVTIIGDDAFYGCSKLTIIIIPDSVTTIGKSAFSYCRALTSITIPNSVITIGNYAFYSCDALTRITIPDSVTTIGNYAFSYCSSLRDVYYSGTKAQWNTITMQAGNGALQNATIHCEIYPLAVEGGRIYFDLSTGAVIDCDLGVTVASIPNTIDGMLITAIGDSAFENCDALTSITIPDSVTTIGKYAFSDCNSLRDVYYSGTKAQWNTITMQAGNGALQNATIHCEIYPLAVEGGNIYFDLSTGAVIDCDLGVTVANIPNDIEGVPVTAIGDDAFHYCSELESITIPDSVTTIGDSAFSWCSSLTSITIPDGVTTIGYYAFYYCSELTSITIPNSVTTIGNYAFSDCNSLSGIWVQEGNKVYSSDTNGVLFNKDKTQLLLCPNGYYGTYAIPDSVTTIGDSAFENCKALTSITIPDGVTIIGYRTFYHCSALTSITIPDSVTTIGGSAFSYCKALTSITIPDGVTTIGYYAFYDCDDLTSITIPDGVTTIGDSAFYDCDDLTSITIPDSVTTIGDDAFSDCNSLSGIWVQEGNEVFSSDTNGVLFNKDKTQLLRCPGGYYGAYTIPDGVTTIGELAFSNCNALTSVTIPDSVTTIGDDAFFDCNALTSITIGDGVTTIGKYAFSWCSSLTSITIPDSITTIGDFAFFYCNALTSITIPDSVTTIGNSAFYACNSLTDVYYYGTEAQWNNITIMAGNEALQNATIHYEPPHDHVWDAGKITTAATCVDAGVKTYTCTVCGGTMTETIPATGKHVDANKDNKCDSCGKDMAVPTDRVAIYNVAHGNVMTTETSVYTSSSGSVKDQLVAAPATLADGILSTAAENVALFKMETNDAGITTFITEDGKYLEADGNNIRFVDAANENTEFVLEEVEGGYYIRLANFKYQGFKDQYVEYYIPKNVYSCYGMGSDTSMYIFNFYPVGNEKPHVCTWDNGVVTKEATCEATGTKTYTCTDCGATKEETIPATDHSYEITYSVEADCKWTGAIRYTCSSCGDVKTETLPALGHSFDSGTVTTPATCTEDGVLTYACERCAETKTETIPATGHSFDQGAVSTPATCTVAGVFTYTCEGCGETKTEPIPATGHLYIRYSNNGPNHSVMCAYCRNIYTEAHNFTAGDCICGAAEPAVDGSIQISHTLNLASDIAINYVLVADSLSGYDSYYMECVTPVYEGNTLVGSTTHILEPELRGSYYYFILDGLTSLEMNDMVEARLYMTKAGKSYTSEPDHYSIATYAYNKLNSSTTAQDLKTVCANLLQYGSKAQLYKEYRTDALPDGEMTAEHRSYLTDPASVAFGNNKAFLGDHSAPTVTFVGAPLRLDSKIIVRYVIDTTAYKGNMEDLSLRVSYEGIDGSIVTETLRDLELYYAPASYYAFDFDGLLASELRTVMSAVVYEGDTPVSETMTYSVDTYGNGRTGSLLTLIQAMMAYSDSCKVYFA